MPIQRATVLIQWAAGVMRERGRREWLWTIRFSCAPLADCHWNAYAKHWRIDRCKCPSIWGALGHGDAVTTGVPRRFVYGFAGLRPRSALLFDPV